MADFTQDFFTGRRNYGDGSTTYVGQKGRLWYDSITNTIRIGDGTAGGKLVADSSSSTLTLNDISDVNVGTPGAGEDGYVLAWDNTAGEYTLQAPSGGGAETDPIFVASPAYNITNTDITNWNTAYGWGDHSSAGYITSLVEDLTPQLGGTLDANGNDIDMGVNTITDTAVGNWNTAYSWGDHAAAGYATLTGINLDGGAVNQILVKQTGTDYDYAWEDLITYEPKYRVEVDDASVNGTMYVGEAAPNSATSAAVWRIKEVILDNKGNVDSVRWANGDNSFSYIYDNRLSYTYS